MLAVGATVFALGFALLRVFARARARIADAPLLPVWIPVWRPAQPLRIVDLSQDACFENLYTGPRTAPTEESRMEPDPDDATLDDNTASEVTEGISDATGTAAVDINKARSDEQQKKVHHEKDQKKILADDKMEKKILGATNKDKYKILAQNCIADAIEELRVLEERADTAKGAKRNDGKRDHFAAFQKVDNKAMIEFITSWKPFFPAAAPGDPRIPTRTDARRPKPTFVNVHPSHVMQTDYLIVVFGGSPRKSRKCTPAVM